MKFRTLDEQKPKIVDSSDNFTIKVNCMTSQITAFATKLYCIWGWVHDSLSSIQFYLKGISWQLHPCSCSSINLDAIISTSWFCDRSLLHTSKMKVLIQNFKIYDFQVQEFLQSSTNIKVGYNVCKYISMLLYLTSQTNRYCWIIYTYYVVIRYDLEVLYEWEIYSRPKEVLV